MAMIAPNTVHFRTDPQSSVVERGRLVTRDEPSVAGGRAGRQRWELALGHGRWTVSLTEGPPSASPR